MANNMQNRIEELEDRYRLIADNLVDAIWVVDAETLSYDFITHSIEKLSGFKAEDFIGYPLQQRVSPANASKVIRDISRGKEAF